MPRYFFHVSNKVRLVDPDGTVLADSELAMAHAIQVMHELMFMRAEMLGQPWSAWTMRVSKKDGETIHTVPFTEIDKSTRNKPAFIGDSKARGRPWRVLPSIYLCLNPKLEAKF